MSGISSSDYTSIAQLDGALAFNFILNETQELISSSALSGLKGLREAMGTGGQIAEAFRQLEQVTRDLGAAVEAENQNQFSAGNSTTALAVATAVDNSLKSQTSGVVNSANAAVSVANVSDNGGSAAAKAKDAADLNRQAADDLAAGDSQAGRSKANSAAVKAGEAVSAAGDELAAAKSQRDAAQDQVNGLDAQLQAAQNANPSNPALIASLTADRNAAEVALNAAQQAVNRAQSLLTAAQTVQTAADATLARANSPIALIDSETPTAYDLENGFTLSTWGSSGYWTLID
jgi:chromosome segregation ATPase